ncbi:MAG: anaerobic ribonucleoside-triphosphate reductase activating protein [Betaproteobacteria bacterium]|nr:anaerobic ribonucleoside-triphosphate reductase activating protein [Betaproteobacteria bacterium]MDE2003547.1 anaerobic ribonucleoside-triphosphate reductase activating protein [Betaproteobacteria bacterium]MDE2210478.1 anaerobic ribonucleoside-triphosphate reductase activating protein [Betaproteobacteria bacterium]MDE2359422.1 anaerobic ribonucleoside-triphosphate reductase activating protein [Betaproteobacteria bacterium]
MPSGVSSPRSARGSQTTWLTERPARVRGALRVGGLTPLSTTDWPGELCAVVFCQGCPWRCGYCHNPGLLPARGRRRIHWDDVCAFLSRRRGLLDGVVFSGGEPLAQGGLADAIADVRRIGFRVGLHTGGAYPRRLAQVLPQVDWVGFDVKALFDDYALVTGVSGSGDAALESARALIASGVDCEFRTTVHPRQLPPATLVRIADRLVEMGVRRYALQQFRSTGCATPAFMGDGLRSRLEEPWVAAIAHNFESFSLRLA